MPQPSAPGFYPSAPGSQPGAPTQITKAGSDTGTGSETVRVSTTWFLGDSAAGSEQVSGSFGDGTVTSFTINEAAAGIDTLQVTRTAPTLFPPPGPRVPQVPLPELRLLVAETRSGRIHYELPYTKLSWSQKINQVGACSATVPLEAAVDAVGQQAGGDPARVLWGFITGPYRYSLVVAYGKTVLWAGPLLPTDEFGTDPQVDVGASEFPSIFGKRLLTKNGTGTAADRSRDVAFTLTNPRSLMTQLVGFAVAKGTGYELPVFSSAPPPSKGDDNYSYLAYDLVPVLKALQTQAAGEDGPDFRFDPFLYAGQDAEYLGYDLRIGDPYLDFGSLWTWDDTTSIVTVSGDAVGMASTLYVPGSGQDRDKRIGAASNTDFVKLGFPALEDTDGTMNSSTAADDLDAYARAAIDAQHSPTVTWKVKALRDGNPPAGQYRVGDLAQVDVRAHRLIDHGTYRSRIVELAGDDGPWVTATLSMTEPDIGAGA